MNKHITFTQALLTGIGLLIGSGIFFRAPRILDATEGNVGIAIIGWLVLGFLLTMAGVGISVLAARSNREGGIIGYMEDVFGKTMSFLTGWFTSMIYIPLLIGVMGIVGAGFLLDLFGMPRTAMAEVSIGFAFILFTFVWNFLSTRFAAMFSSVATIIKLIPIVLLGTIGIFNLDAHMISTDVSNFDVRLLSAPLISMAFAMDGWTTVATFAKDMENPKRDISRILILVLVIVTLAYTVYFTGVCMLLEPQQIMALGDEHIAVITTKLFGEFGSKVILFCVVASVMGVLNGNVMGSFRYTHALATSNDLPNSKYFKEVNTYGTTGRVGVLSFIVVCAWFVLYAVQSFAGEAAAEGEPYLLSGISLDDIPIVWIAVIISILLIGTMKIAKKENVGVFKGYIAPLIGLFGQFYIISSFIQSNEAWFIYSLVVIFAFIIGVIIRSAGKKSNLKHQ